MTARQPDHEIPPPSGTNEPGSKPLRIAWITHAPNAAVHGGAATFNRAVFRLLAAMPQPSELTEISLRTEPSRMPHRLRQLLAVLRSAPSPYPAKAMFHIPAGVMPGLVSRIAATTPDIAVLSSTDLLPCRAVLGDIPMVVVAHNVEQMLYARQVEVAARQLPLAGPFLRADLAKLRRMETAGLQAARLIVAISTEDAAWFPAHGIDTPVFTLPPLFPAPLPAHARPRPARPLRLAFVAKMSWWPNRIGCRWLIREVLSKLRPGSVKLNVYGPGSEAMHDPAAGIIGHGFIDRLEEVWARNHIAVCPIDQGSGVNVKLVESLYNGLPVLTTRFGARGLPALTRDPAIRFCDGADAWVDFLRSPQAEVLAGLVPADATRRLFLDESYRADFAAAIARAAGRTPNQPI